LFPAQPHGYGTQRSALNTVCMQPVVYLDGNAGPADYTAPSDGSDARPHAGDPSRLGPNSSRKSRTARSRSANPDSSTGMCPAPRNAAHRVGPPGAIATRARKERESRPGSQWSSSGQASNNGGPEYTSGGTTGPLVRQVRANRNGRPRAPPAGSTRTRFANWLWLLIAARFVTH